MNRDQINDEVFVKVAELILLMQAAEFRADTNVDWALDQLSDKLQKHFDAAATRHACLGCGVPYCTSCH